jgi:2'-5' RNA ligase
MRRDEPHGIRAFVAVLLPAEVRRRLGAVVDQLRPRAARVSWVAEANLHLTLRFLGAVDEAVLGRVREAVEVAAAASAPFTLGVGGLGGFPRDRTPRVVWAGVVAGAEALSALHGRLETALAARGVPPEARAFHGHVTLGRARDPRGTPELAAALTGAPVAFGELLVDAVHLMRSELDPQGARYSVLARCPLGAR